MKISRVKSLIRRPIVARDGPAIGPDGLR